MSTTEPPAAPHTAPNSAQPVGGFVPLGPPLMAVQVVGGLSGEHLSDPQERLLRDLLAQQLTTLLPGTFIGTASRAVVGMGTMIGVFAARPNLGNRQDEIDDCLTGLALHSAIPDNLAIFGSVELLDMIAQRLRPAIDAQLRNAGATADSVQVVVERNAAGAPQLITRLKGVVTKTRHDFGYTADVRDHHLTTEVPDATIEFPTANGPWILPEVRLIAEGSVEFDPDTHSRVVGSILSLLGGSILLAAGGPGRIALFTASLLLGAEAAGANRYQPPAQGGAGSAFVQLIQFDDVMVPNVLARPVSGVERSFQHPKPVRIGLSYERVDTRADGIVVRGRLCSVERRPRIFEISPSTVIVPAGSPSVAVNCRVLVRDLRAPIFAWTVNIGSIVHADTATPTVTFELPVMMLNETVTRRVSLSVVDADGLRVAHDLDIVVRALDQRAFDEGSGSKRDRRVPATS